MATTAIDGLATQYEVVGSGPPLLMFSPGGFDATLDKWLTPGIYAKIKILDHRSASSVASFLIVASPAVREDVSSRSGGSTT